MQAFQAAGQQVASRNATYDLKNETGNVHRRFLILSGAAPSRQAALRRYSQRATACKGVWNKKPALRRQRILWRRRVGVASAKPTSAVKVLEKSEIMSRLFLLSHRNNLHP